MALILVADDDAASRLLVATVLRHAGHTIVETADGEAALAAVAAECPDLLLIDLNMPGISGVDVIRRLRIDAALSDVSIALYTATPPNAAMRDFMEIYAIKAAVPKPSEPEELLRAVEDALAP